MTALKTLSFRHKLNRDLSRQPILPSAIPYSISKLDEVHVYLQCRMCQSFLCVNQSTCRIALLGVFSTTTKARFSVSHGLHNIIHREREEGDTNWNPLTRGDTILELQVMMDPIMINDRRTILIAVDGSEGNKPVNKFEELDPIVFR